VILWNDDDHTYAYVITMLMELFGYPPEKGFQMAKEVDTQGRVIVFTSTLEHAELKRDQIHAYGKDDMIKNCKGAMYATLEAVPGEE
jgi:ATP-dependent Clp protease adaptor protein ClpS